MSWASRRYGWLVVACAALVVSSVLVPAASDAAATRAHTGRSATRSAEIRRADALFGAGDMRHALPLYQKLSVSGRTDAEMQWAILHAGLALEGLCQDSLAVVTWRTGLRRFPGGRFAREMALYSAEALSRLPGREQEADVALSDVVSDSTHARYEITAAGCLARAEYRLAHFDTLGARADLHDLARPHAGPVPGIEEARRLLSNWPAAVRQGLLLSAIRAWQAGQDRQALAHLKSLAETADPDAQDDSGVRAARALLARHLETDSTLTMPWLGVRLKPGRTVVGCADPDRAVSGGVRVGDRIVSVAGSPVRRESDLFAAVAGLEINKAARVVVERGGRRRTVTLIVSAMQRSHAAP